MNTQRFFTIVNHGFSKQEIERQVDIGHAVLQHMSEDDIADMLA